MILNINLPGLKPFITDNITYIFLSFLIVELIPLIKVQDKLFL